MDRPALARRIAEIAVLRGQFTLRSGRTSNYYLDKYRFETQPDILSALAKMFAEKIGDHVQRIAGAELGAVVLAAATSIETGMPFVIIRNQKKDYGTSNLIEGPVVAGETVVLLEDILTSGGQVLEAAHSLESAGAKIDRIIGVIDRQEGAREKIEAAGYRFEALFTVSELGINKD